jgi:AraC-like DNA-binding protein
VTEIASRIRVAAHASEQGSWRMAFLAPAAPMAPLVRQINAYAEHDTQFARRHELPTGTAVLVFNLGPELRVEHPADTKARFAGGSGFYAGPSAAYAVTETDGAQDGAQVMLTLLGARRLLGRPLREFGDGLIDPAEVLGGAADAILGRLLETGSHGRRLAILEDALARRFAQVEGVPRDLAWTWQRLQRSAGRLRVGDLAAELGCSRKHLSIRFRDEFGMAPKLFARILRFDRAIHLIRRDRVTSWAALADECGYADQAHMTREFHVFAGHPPMALLRRRLPDDGGFRD